ncbi:MAG: hypothetical protein LBV45_00155, partial [Xanthomonadaceae bacterium]|nr:hypothetical protein [Xanthomonadaceae bacterium]
MSSYLKIPGILLSMMLLVCDVQPLAAQTTSPGANTGYALASGDAWLDKTLPDVNVYAQRYTESFLDELVRYAGMPRDYAYALINTHGWFPADVYFAAMLAKTLG